MRQVRRRFMRNWSFADERCQRVPAVFFGACIKALLQVAIPDQDIEPKFGQVRATGSPTWRSFYKAALPASVHDIDQLPCTPITHSHLAGCAGDRTRGSNAFQQVGFSRTHGDCIIAQHLQFQLDSLLHRMPRTTISTAASLRSRARRSSDCKKLRQAEAYPTIAIDSVTMRSPRRRPDNQADSIRGPISQSPQAPTCKAGFQRQPTPVPADKA